MEVADLKAKIKQKDDDLEDLSKELTQSRALASMYNSKLRAEIPAGPSDSGHSDWKQLAETYVMEAADLKANLKKRDNDLELRRKLRQSRALAALYKSKWRAENPAEPSDSGESDSWEPGSSMGPPLPTALLCLDHRVGANLT